MKVTSFFTAILMLSSVKLSQSFEEDFGFRERGLCIENPTSCYSRVQDKGICCKPAGESQSRYFDNFCQGCQAVLI